MAIPNMWRTKKQRYSLQGDICPTCASAIFPPRNVCPHCGSSMDATKNHRHNPQVVHALVVNTPFVVQPTLLENPAGDD